MGPFQKILQNHSVYARTTNYLLTYPPSPLLVMPCWTVSKSERTGAHRPGPFQIFLPWRSKLVFFLRDEYNSCQIWRVSHKMWVQRYDSTAGISQTHAWRLWNGAFIFSAEFFCPLWPFFLSSLFKKITPLKRPAVEWRNLLFIAINQQIGSCTGCQSRSKMTRLFYGSN